MSLRKHSFWILRTAWTFPTSAPGLAVGVLSVPFGARWQIRRGTLECYGGPVRFLLEKCTVLPNGARAMTLGDVILGVSSAALDICRDHEQVHVRQAHRWGPFFLPAYLLASLMAKVRGRNAYRDSPFEREAYDAVPPHRI